MLVDCEPSTLHVISNSPIPIIKIRWACSIFYSGICPGTLNSLGGSWGMKESGSIEQIFYSPNGKYFKIKLYFTERKKKGGELFFSWFVVNKWLLTFVYHSLRLNIILEKYHTFSKEKMDHDQKIWVCGHSSEYKQHIIK